MKNYLSFTSLIILVCAFTSKTNAQTDATNLDWLREPAQSQGRHIAGAPVTLGDSGERNNSLRLVTGLKSAQVASTVIMLDEKGRELVIPAPDMSNVNSIIVIRTPVVEENSRFKLSPAVYWELHHSDAVPRQYFPK